MHIFYHVHKAPGWEALVKEQLHKIVSSGLYAACRNLIICTSGSNDDVSWIKRNYPKVELLRDSVENNFELPTIIALKAYCSQLSGKEAILYIHTKGVTKLLSEPVRNWRLLMEHYLIDNWKDCLCRVADGYDCVGVILRSRPVKHFSGNFWWANSGYINKLEGLTLQSDRMAPEFWLASGKGRFLSLYNTPIDTYYSSEVVYPEIEYTTEALNIDYQPDPVD